MIRSFCCRIADWLVYWLYTARDWYWINPLVPLKIILANGFPKVSYFILSNEKMGISKGPLKKSKYEIKNWFVSFDRLPKPLLDFIKKRSWQMTSPILHTVAVNKINLGRHRNQVKTGKTGLLDNFQTRNQLLLLTVPWARWDVVQVLPGRRIWAGELNRPEAAKLFRPAFDSFQSIVERIPIQVEPFSSTSPNRFRSLPGRK